MFESDSAGEHAAQMPRLTVTRNPISRYFKYAVLLATFLSSTLLVWGFVEKFQEAADRVN